MIIKKKLFYSSALTFIRNGIYSNKTRRNGASYCQEQEQFERHHELFLNETILSVKILNIKIPNWTTNSCKNPECKNPEKGKGTELGEGERD
jgi:hypothetical protein